MAKDKPSKSSKTTVHRDAKSGKFVSKGYAEKHPKSTIKVTIKKGGTDHTGPRRK